MQMKRLRNWETVIMLQQVERVWNCSHEYMTAANAEYQVIKKGDSSFAAFATLK